MLININSFYTEMLTGCSGYQIILKLIFFMLLFFVIKSLSAVNICFAARHFFDARVYSHVCVMSTLVNMIYSYFPDEKSCFQSIKEKRKRCGPKLRWIKTFDMDL